MTSNIITIHSSGAGFDDAHLETERMGAALPEDRYGGPFRI